MAAAKSISPLLLSLYLSLLVLFPTSSSSSSQLLVEGGAGRKVGGRVEINDVKTNKKIQDLGRFSVKEYNEVHQTHLSFFRVIRAQSQVVSGIKYYLEIEATEANESNGREQFAAVVVEKPWLPSKKLLFFAPSSPHTQ